MFLRNLRKLTRYKNMNKIDNRVNIRKFVKKIHFFFYKKGL